MATATTGPTLPSNVRTIFPIVIALLAQQGIETLPGIDSTAFSMLLAGVVTWLYYFFVRILERVSSTKWGWLLGYPAAPVYAGEHVAR